MCQRPVDLSQFLIEVIIIEPDREQGVECRALGPEHAACRELKRHVAVDYAADPFEQ